MTVANSEGERVQLPATANSAGRARGMVRDALTRLGRDELVDDATLVISELLANAVLHARTDMELAVEESGAGIRLAVSDGSSIQPRWAPAVATATSGRGLILVQQLCSAWGVQPHGDDGKTVWALIERASAAGDESSVEDLLAMWTDEFDPPQPTREVIEVVVDVDVDAMLASRAHTEDLVRELQLVALGAHQHPVASSVLDLAHRLAVATEAFYGPRRQLLDQTLSAAQRGQTTAALHLYLHRDDAAAARRWLDALDDADAMTA